MLAMLDPATIAGLAVGLMTAAGFLLVTFAVEGPGSRRLSRRVEALKGRKPGAASGQAAVRSLRAATTPPRWTMSRGDGCHGATC
jgi:hypothetical protein